MKQLVNKNLITLKCVLFTFLAGIGCIFPFLPLHMLAVGLTRDEARVVSILAPCIAMLGPVIAGPLVDKLSVGRGANGGANSGGSGRILQRIIAGCLVLSAVFYLLLLAVPVSQRDPALRPHVTFTCDPNGAVVLQEVCTEEPTCNRWTGEKTGDLVLSNCEYACDAPPSSYVGVTEAPRIEKFEVVNMTNLSPEFGGSELSDLEGVQSDTGLLLEEKQDFLADWNTNDDDDDDQSVDPPHLCQGRGAEPGFCHVFTGHSPTMTVPVTLLPGQDNVSDTEWCAYPQAGEFHCPVPAMHAEQLQQEASANNHSCTPVVRCMVEDPYDTPGGVLADNHCRKVIGDPVATFWSYLIIRCIADIWPTTALGLLGAACVVATRDTSVGRGDVGRQLAWGTLGLALLPPLAGLAAPEVDNPPYTLPIVIAAILFLIGAVILLVDGKMPLSPPEWWWHTASGMLAMPMNTVRRYGAETAGLFFVLTLLGVLWSALDSYIPWAFKDLEGTDDVLVGLSLTIGALPAIPVLWWAEAVVDFCGHSNLLITAFTFYGLRYTGMSQMTDARWILLCEALEVFTLSLVWVTAVLYFRHLVPRKYTCTGQALPVIAHFCLGRCIGAAVGGLTALPGIRAAQATWGALAIASLVVAAVYLALYHLLLAPRCAAPRASPPQALLQGLNSNGGSNGAYSPMRVYHEERSRKGQFRY